MSSIQRPLSGDVLRFDLGEERGHAQDATILERSGRNARTLLKEGPLRVTLVVLAPGGEIAEHQASGPITVQPLEGRIRFAIAGEDHDIGPGELLSVAPGVRHRVRSAAGATFLLTVASAAEEGP
jgi:quercetin dioxygenase-like cupin family protein